MQKNCAICRRHRCTDGVLRCEERRSSAIGGVIVFDVALAKRAESFERVCALVAARCALFQAVSDA